MQQSGENKKKKRRREAGNDSFCLSWKREVWKKYESLRFWLLVVVFFHYNFISTYGNKDIKWNTILLLLYCTNLHATLKAFNEFIEQCKFQYQAQYPEPPKHTTEACITKWTVTTKKEPAHTDIEFINKCGSWKIK